MATTHSNPNQGQSRQQNTGHQVSDPQKMRETERKSSEQTSKGNPSTPNRSGTQGNPSRHS